MKLELWLPVKPFHVNQSFGGSAEYYSKFKDQYGNPEKGHNGLDLMALHGQPVYASVDGLATYNSDVHGGEGVYIRTELKGYQNGTCNFNVIHWHLIGDTDPKFPKPFQSKQVKVGELIGYADNTGAPYESSGDHLHLGLIPTDPYGKALFPANGYNGCIDPAPFLNNYYAADSGTVLGIYAKIVSLISNFLKK